MILMNNFKAEEAEVREQMLMAARRVLESGWYVLGQEVAAFEQSWANTCGTDYAVGVGNGMDAIEIALRASGVGPGDEVITTPMTAFATVLAILRAGAIPVLADIVPGTALLCPHSAARCVSQRTRAVVLVHLYGQLRDMQTWQAFCADQDILLIEDCAQAHLAVCDGGAAGSFGAAGAFSFYPTKNLGAVGDAGMVVTSDRNIAQISGRLRNYGQNKRYDHSELGLNSRLDELQAAMLTERLKWLPGFTRRRTEIAGKYRSGLKNERIRLLDAPETDTSHVYHLFVIKCDRREALQDHLSAHDVQSLVHYPIPVHQQTSCPDISRDPEGLPNSEKFASTCLSLPCHPQLSDDEVDKVIRVVNAFQGC